MSQIPYSEFILFAVIGLMMIRAIFDGKRRQMREKQLLNAVIAKHLPEYTQSMETPKGRVQEMNAEIRLAGKATKLEAEMNKNNSIGNEYDGGIPV